MLLWYDREGKPIDLWEWVKRIEDREYAVIAQHRVMGWKVSTIWDGIDTMSAIFGGIPAIFETMIFTPEGETDGEPGHYGWFSGYRVRYATDLGAAAGHYAAIMWLAGKISDSNRALT
jgi:hypothetical protein